MILLINFLSCNFLLKIVLLYTSIQISILLISCIYSQTNYYNTIRVQHHFIQTIFSLVLGLWSLNAYIIYIDRYTVSNLILQYKCYIVMHDLQRVSIAYRKHGKPKCPEWSIEGSYIVAYRIYFMLIRCNIKIKVSIDVYAQELFSKHFYKWRYSYILYEDLHIFEDNLKCSYTSTNPYTQIEHTL